MLDQLVVDLMWQFRIIIERLQTEYQFADDHFREG